MLHTRKETQREILNSTNLAEGNVLPHEQK